MHDIIFKLQFAKCLIGENCYHLLSSSQCSIHMAKTATASIVLNVMGLNIMLTNSPNLLSLCYQCYHWFALKYHIPKSGILILRKNGLPFSGHPTKCNQIANSPQNGVSYFENKYFTVFRGCSKIHDFLTFMGEFNDDMQYAHLKSIKFRRRIWRKCYHLLSFCYHLETNYSIHIKCPTHI